MSSYRLQEFIPKMCVCSLSFHMYIYLIAVLLKNEGLLLKFGSHRETCKNIDISEALYT